MAIFTEFSVYKLLIISIDLATPYPHFDFAVIERSRDAVQALKRGVSGQKTSF